MGTLSNLTGEATATAAGAAYEAVFQRFEAAWRQGPPPAIDDYLTDTANAPPGLLLELVHIDLEFRLKAGEATRVEQYLSRYPRLTADREALRDLIRAEYRLRQRSQPDLTPGEYLERFPQFGPELAGYLAGAGESTRLDLAALESTRTRWPTDLPGYEIIGELGRGGMGIVYKAVQRSLHRTVALKMIRGGAHASAEQLARFRIEAEALASLQHPNIVQIHEIGQHAGCPYMAMEFLEGGSLAHRLDGQPQPPRSAALLVESLARAMHCAHLRGIVHRDLKPANVLLASIDSQVLNTESTSSALTTQHSVLSTSLAKITDFGLAKRLAEEERQTASGVIMGTPSYMAPEQAQGKSHGVGPPADVYALGAILYEMLTGRPPFLGETQLETIRQVLSDEPTAPGLLQPAVPRDLATVCLKSLEKDPARRYASAEALADDLRRYLNDEPVLARPAGVAERTAKWLKRHPALSALIGVTTAAALALLVGGWVSYHQVHTAYVETSHQRDRATENARVAFEAVDHLYTRLAEERLLDEPHKDPLREELLARAPLLYERLAQQQDADPTMRREIGLAWFRLGDIHRILDQADRAATEFRQAIARQEALCGDYPANAAYWRELAESYTWLGELLREDHQRLLEAERQFRQALEHQTRARQLLPGEGPEQRKCLLGLARSHYNRGLVAMDTARPDQAGADYDRAVDLLTTLHRAVPDDANCRQDLARALNNRGILHKDQKRPAQARRDYEQARSHLAALRRLFPARTTYKYELALVCQNLGNVLLGTDLPGARAADNDALVLLKELTADFSTRPRYQKKLASALNGEGIVLAQTGDCVGASQCWTQARDLLQKLPREASPSRERDALLGIALGNLGWLKTEEENWTEARLLLEAALMHLQAGLPPDVKRKDYQQALRQNVQSLTETLVQLGDHAAAVNAAERLADLHPREARNSYYAACFIARCIPLAQEDMKLGDLPARGAVARRYADQAVAALRQTPSRGVANLTRLANEKKLLEALASHPGFSEALRALDSITKRP
jgi:serine/threonine protein kinase/tetratricopeptide (TPR) repeat protein